MSRRELSKDEANFVLRRCQNGTIDVDELPAWMVSAVVDVLEPEDATVREYDEFTRELRTAGIIR